MSDEIPQDFLQEFRALMQDNDAVEFWDSRYTWWCVLATIQLASRHPAARETTAVAKAIQFAREIEKRIARPSLLWRASHARGGNHEPDFA